MHIESIAIIVSIYARMQSMAAKRATVKLTHIPSCGIDERSQILFLDDRSSFWSSIRMHLDRQRSKVLNLGLDGEVVQRRKRGKKWRDLI